MRGLLNELIRPSMRASDPNPDDERYWNPMLSAISATGIRVTPDLAFQCSCVYQGVRVIAQTLGSLSVRLYRDVDDEHKVLAKDNPLWPLLRQAPNAWQTSQEFREVMTARAILWNNAIAEIIPGARGAVDEVIPIDPDDVVAVEQMARPNGRRGGRLRYRIRTSSGGEEVLVQEQVFHLRGFGAHQFFPPALLTLAREAIGLWIALEKFESLFFLQGARPGIVLEHPATLSKPAYDRLKQSLAERVEGLSRMHRPFITEEGIKLSSYGFNLRDSQATEARMFQVDDLARWLNLPVHMLKAAKQPTFASIEQFAREYVDYTVLPWATRWEGSIWRDLVVVDRETVYAKFILDSLLRGNTTDRATAYQVFVTNGIFTRNEVRAMEDRDPLPGLDEPLTPMNMDQGGRAALSSGSQRRAPEPDPEDEDDEDQPESAAARHGRLMIRAHAQRIARKEISAVRAQAVKLAGKPAPWKDWIAVFYREHATAVAEGLQLVPVLVREHIEAHQRALETEGIAVLERWEQETAGELVALATGERAHA